MPLDPAILERNLRALARTAPRAVERIRAATAAAGATFEPTDEGALALALDGRWLTSRRRPLVEASRLAETVTLAETGVVVTLGFGAGHHIAQLARRVKMAGLIICFEPDVALLRAALERIDISEAVAQSNILLLTQADDSAELSARLAGAEALVALGVQIVEHPPSKARLGAGSARFLEMFTGVTRAVRTTLVTTLAHAQKTLSNELGNVGCYVASPGVAELAQSLAGRPAIVVSAGPSLQRNIDLLAAPGVRDRFLIVAVQTALKPLLAAGVVPHFVTALDYSDISARFYEGLTARDVEGATLVVEPKASPAIPRAWPGALRMPRSAFLDELLGVQLAGDHGELRPGATVAHLAYYLARHLGCDPVILTGQDLGFTDGQYYASGAAIHTVWSGELNPLRTLEMFEHERIVRSRHMLRPATDTLGRRMWTDEQMETYRMQFERDFAADEQRGLRVIDATEGGARKAHSEAMPLAEALERFDGGPLDLPPAPECCTEALTSEQVSGTMRRRPLRAAVGGAGARCREAAGEMRRLGELSRETLAILKRMPDETNERRLNRLIEQARETGARARAIQPAFHLVQLLNQTGALKRVRADRAIGAGDLDAASRQRRQIERDIINVEWTADAADELARMVDQAADTIDAAGVAEPHSIEHPGAKGPERSLGDAGAIRRAPVVIFVDESLGGLGQQRDLAAPIAGATLLAWTLRRLARCALVERVILVSADPGAARAIAGEPPAGLPVEYLALERDLRARRRAIGAARRFSAACWRGGPAGLTIYDEALDPAALDDVMERLGLVEAVVVGADWALIDPAIVDGIIRRQREDEQKRTLVFSQSPPGLGAVLIARQIARDLAASVPTAGPFSTIGALVGYLPSSPRPDPIATGMCVACAPAVRDLGVRLIPDAPGARALVEQLLGAPEGTPGASDADAIAAALAARGDRALRRLPPQRLTLELCVGRLTSGARRRWMRQQEPPERPAMTLDLAARAIEQFADMTPAGAITLAGAGDPLQSPILIDVLRLGQRAGLTMHVRTDLLCEPERADALVEAGADIISVDVLAGDSVTYRALQGVDGYDRVLANLDRLIDRRVRAGGVPLPWVAPRITRCDAVYGQVEPFYDRWLLRAGAAVIDPLPRLQPGERIGPLELPAGARRRRSAEEITVLSDGAVLAPSDVSRDATSDTGATRPIGDLSRQTLAEICNGRRPARRAALV